METICKELLAPSTYYAQRAMESDSGRMSKRARRDGELMVRIRRIWQEGHRCYGVRKVWGQLAREGVEVARCTVERLMRSEGLAGVVRGRRCRTTGAQEAADRPRDLVRRRFVAERPNRLWVAHITCVPVGSSVVYVTLVTDVYARRIVGWKVACAMRTELVLDALEQALHARSDTEVLIHHSDRGSQYLSIRHSARLAETDPSRMWWNKRKVA